jgi:hypothetical protein
MAVPLEEAQGYLAGSTGVVSTADDLATYLAFQAGAHPASDTVLSAAGREALHSPPTGIGSTYGMGWFREEDPELGPVLHHNGVLGTFHADAVVVPSQQLGIVALYNSSHSLAAYDATWRGLLELTRGRSPAAGPIDAREIELAFAALTILTVALRLRNMARARHRARPRPTSPRSVLRMGWGLLPTATFLALPAVVSATSGRVFTLGQIVTAMPGASLFLLANALTGIAAIAANLAGRRPAVGVQT